MLSILGKAVLGAIMSFATEEFFREMIVFLAKKAAESSKTSWDDELVSAIEKQLDNQPKG